jgi:hypothetical protein
MDLSLEICYLRNSSDGLSDLVFRNIIHGSDAVESAQKEIALWFPEGVAHYATALAPWIYENP